MAYMESAGMPSDFEDRLEEMRGKVTQLKDSLHSEVVTKNALTMPFIKDALGYDVFCPQEVIAEFTADQGIKKGEKVDYAIRKDDAIQILIECKKAGEKLSPNHASQLYRYFSVTDASIAILTNGIQYLFYTDLDAPNRMDKASSMEIDFALINWRLVDELRKISKSDLDLADFISAAGALKYNK